MKYPTPSLWRASPVDPHDGDTVVFLIDRGGPNRDRSLWSIRLVNTFAPELRQTGGPECQKFVADWLVKHSDGTEWPFLVETFQTPKSDALEGTLGRILGRVTAADGACLNVDSQAFVTANGYPGGIGS